METWIHIAGISCTLYFVGELLRLAHRTVGGGLDARHGRTGRRLRLRRDRRFGERRGAPHPLR